MALTLIASFTAADIIATSAGLTGNTCMAAAPNDGTYSRTNSSVSVYTENGHPKAQRSEAVRHAKKLTRGMSKRQK